MKTTASLRDKYLSEKERILNEIGSLDDVLLKLGLSQRKACQLLLVDPSAWTRWNKTGAPPHIYQALSWLLQLKQLNPHVVNSPSIETRVDSIESRTQAKILELEKSVDMLERTLALQTVATPYAAPDHQALIESALSVQEKRHQKEIHELLARIESLSQKPAKRSAKKPKPQSRSRFKKRNKKITKPLTAKKKSAAKGRSAKKKPHVVVRKSLKPKKRKR